MSKQRFEILSLVLLFLVGAGFSSHAASGPPMSKKKGSTGLGANSLKGGMQGHSGIAMDLNNDGLKDLVVGAPYAKLRNKVGAIQIYLAHSKGFSAKPTRIIRDDGNFGWSLAGLGNNSSGGNGLFAVGAYSGSGENVSLSGTVTVYQGGKNSQKALVLEGDNAMDKFGYAVASGDLNGDGSIDLIVGAPFHSPSPALYQKGAVYVYFGPDFEMSGRLKIAATAEYGGIGFSLATGDINDDGVDDLLMEAAGKVIGFYGGQDFSTSTGGGPNLTVTGRDRGYGRSIAVLWDLDQDGFNDIAIGAQQAVVAGVIDSGRVFIVKGGDGTRVINADANSTDRLAMIEGAMDCGMFGAQVLPVDDVNGDGTPDLLVSAPHADGDPWLMTGKLYLFSGSGLAGDATVSIAQSLPGKKRDMHLGFFLAALGRGNLVAVGAPTERNNTGRVRLMDLNTAGME